MRTPRQSNISPSPPDRRLFYLSLASGSSGNSCYVGTATGGVIIDAGIRADEIELKLRSNGIDMRSVRGLLLTHDHTDHIKYAYQLLRNNRHIKLFCTPRVLNGILRRHSISKRIKEYHVPIFKEIPFKIGDFSITAFDVPHDASDSMGFSIEFDSRNFVLATDLGAVTDRARYYMERANYLVIESNYDLEMLLKGSYPEYLKARIRTPNGHLDNVDTAEFLQSIVNPGLKYIFLCHLSRENNIPTLALKTVSEALRRAGVSIGDCSGSLSTREADVQLMALPRERTSPLFVFRPF
ncbi:MAG: MBL fold metallo-hydrolase [Clostridium sp.]|nr:MBL fold metallo-hydrolase [Prevotella sp.]MCM1428882.1 MBL fold metallo-hydrolase [Clostridium sp.]MCM1475261.1 MBL fold metallo-hydrolase [Muribaculaceae bacterium]